MAVQGMNRGMAQRRRLASMSCIEKKTEIRVKSYYLGNG